MSKLCLTSLLLSLFLLSSCATKFMPADPYQSQTRLDNYLQNSKLAEPSTNFTGSIRLTDPNQSVRLNYILWSNGSYPLRIDLMHSQAGIMAKIYEDQDLVLIYTPENNELHKLHGSSEYLVINKINLPFGLYQLSQLMQNKMPQVFGQPKMSDVKAISPEIFRYQLERGQIDLNSQGQVLTWYENGSKAWFMQIEYFENLPLSLKLEHPNGQKATILIKSRQSNFYEPNKLELQYPPDVTIKEIK